MKKKSPIAEALRETVQDLVDGGYKTPFTDKELKRMGVVIKKEDKDG